METYKFKSSTLESDKIVIPIIFLFLAIPAALVEIVQYYRASAHFTALIDTLLSISVLLVIIIFYLLSRKLLAKGVKEYTVQLDNLMITVSADGKEILRGKAAACDIKTKPGTYVTVNIITDRGKIFFQGRASYLKTPLMGKNKNPLGMSTEEDMEHLLALGKAIRKNLGLDANAHRLGEAALTEADLEEKWNRDIPEMDDLSPAENEAITHRAKVHMIIVCGVLLIIELFFLGWLASEYSFLMSFFDFLSETTAFDLALAETRGQRIAIYIGNVVFMLPIVLLILLPQIIIIFGFRKKFIRRAARKWCRRWRLASDEGTTDKFTYEDVKSEMESLQNGKIQYLILSPPAGTMHSPFMQTYHQEGNLFVMEVKIKEKEGPAVYKKNSLTKEQVLYAMYNYMNKQRIPDTSDWEKINFSPRKAKALA